MTQSLKTVGVTCHCEYFSVLNYRPAAVVLLSRGRLVWRVPEEAIDDKQTPGVFECTAEPAVVLVGFLHGPADMDALCAVPTQLTLQLVCLGSIHIPTQVQLRSYDRAESCGVETNRRLLCVKLRGTVEHTTSEQERDGVGINGSVSFLSKLQHGISGDELSLCVSLAVHKHMFVSKLTWQPGHLIDTRDTWETHIISQCSRSIIRNSLL